MGFVKYINFTGLSDKERRALQDLLESQKQELEAALRNTNQGLKILKKRPAKKKKAAKKSKKAKKSKR